MQLDINQNLDTFIFDWGGGYGIVLERQQVMAHKHIPIETWLEALGLREYEDVFSDYRGVEDLLNMTEADIKDMGLKHSAHRAKIISSLRILKDKYERGYKIPRVIHRSHSASAQKHRQRKCYSMMDIPTITVQLSGTTANSLPNTGSFPDYQVVNISPERLEHDLISELNSDPSELKHWPWYHGSVSRQHVVGLVKNSGDFLVRDSVSQPGDFVLTCSWRGVPLHFVINSEVKERENQPPEISYHFEDDRFCSVQDLIQFYMTYHKPVTKAAGTLLINPIARTMPLSYYDTKYGFLGNNINNTGHYTPVHSPKSSPFNTPQSSPGGSPLSERRTVRTGSQPVLSVGEGTHRGNDNSMFVPFIDRCESLPIIPAPSVPSNHSKKTPETPPVNVFHQRAGSEPAMNMDPVKKEAPKSNYLELPKKMNSSTSDSDLNKPPPPKPSRIPSVKYIGKDRPKITIRNQELYDDDDGRDYADYSQVKESPSWLKFSPEAQQRINAQLNNNNVNGESDYDNNYNCVNVTHRKQVSNLPVNGFPQSVPQKSRKFSETRFSILDSRDYGEIPQTPVTPKMAQFDSLDEYDDYVVHMRNRKLSVPNTGETLRLNPTEFTSTLISNDNKPLEPSVLLTLKQLLLDGNIHHLAQHLTKNDLDICRVIQESDLGMGVKSGLELVTLPHGKQLRQIITERCYCMKVFVMVMILTCPTVKERAKMLSQFIQISVELRSTMGNLFGFANVMEGLTSSQVLRLRDTWLVLRQSHTSSAFQFDTKLKAAYKALNDGSGLLPLQNVSIPDVAPLVFLMERDSDTLTNYLPWEKSDQNFGLDILLTHLDTARLITAQCGLYKVTAESLMVDFKPEQHTMDMFNTEFHLRMLWGAKGAIVNRTDRQTKFEQLLTVLSDRAEPPGDDGTAL